LNFNHKQNTTIPNLHNRRIHLGLSAFDFLYKNFNKNMTKGFWVALATLVSFSAIAQNAKISGKVADDKGEGLIQANVIIDVSKGWAAVTDFDGNYELSVPAGTYSVLFKYVGKDEKRVKITVAENEKKTLNATLLEREQLMDIVVVTGSKYEKKLSEETVSMDVLKSDLLKNNSINSLDAGMNRVPGVTVVDGQANIRGGAGWSYGAGSRVAILYDGMPIMSADAADAKWSAIPVENLEQVEIIKGAASALYGSSALNGIINARSAVPGNEPYTRLQMSAGVYEGPKSNSSLGKAWDSKTHAFGNFNFADRRKIGQVDLVTGAAYDGNKGYLDSSDGSWMRANIKIRWRVKQVEGLNMGVNVTAYHSWGKTFFIWRGIDSLGYKPLPNSVSVYRTYRATIDPFINYYDKKDNQFTLRGRIFTSPNYNNTGQGSIPTKYYGEFQYSRPFLKNKKNFNMNMVAGAIGTYDQVRSPAGARGSLFGNKVGYSAAVYAQLDMKIVKTLNLTFGARWEYFQIENQNSLKDLPYPVFRVGANYQAAEATFLRASFGQGFRYPTIAEKYIRTNVGAIGIYPNPRVEPEKGYSAEVGVKQGFRFGKWSGFADAAVFYNGYTNMMEFTFGQFGPQSSWTNSAELLGLGFSSQNIGNIRIVGTEILGAISGNLSNDLSMNFIFGYTFIDPKVQGNSWDKDTLKLYNVDGVRTTTVGREDSSLSNPQSYAATSSSKTNILKYRNRHTVRLDYTIAWKVLEFNANLQFNSYVENIDYAFLGQLFAGLESQFSSQSFSGLYEFRRRQEAKKIKGDMILNTTFAWNITPKIKLGFLIKNLLNWEYVTRPGYYAEPRNYTMQFAYQF
jgi:iron complex outermembrane receptor protein